MKYGRMDALRQQYPVAVMSRVFEVSESGYYAWRDRPLSPRAQENARLEVEIRAAHQRTRETCGPERLQSDLADHGIRAGVDRIKRIRKKLGLRCKQKRKFKVTTDSKHNLPVAPNLLERNFAVAAPNRAWVSDITYIPTDEGWLYLAGLKDLFNGELVGYAMSERMTKNLVMQALFRGVSAKRPAKGLILHSDRGSQYTADDYLALLKAHGIHVSMSGKGNPYDNAMMESFFSTLRAELTDLQRCLTRQAARTAVFEFIEVFYNRQRLHSSVGYRSPADFETAHLS